MISKINRLTNFGNYRQFQWGGIAPFTKHNLIYGWNYSGKTTLSRLFQILAEPNHLAQWQGCQFEVELQNGSTITHATLTNPPRIKVFNRDFISRNFQQEHKAPAVFIVGGNAIQLRNRISRLNQHETTINALKARNNERQKQRRKELESLARSDASATANLTGDKTYNRTKLVAEIERVKTTPDSFILNDEALQAKVSLLRSTDVWKSIDPVSAPSIQLETLRQDLFAVIQKAASNEAIVKLKENRELESWIRAGLAHHVESSQCEFCGSIIPEDRLNVLQKHFSKAYEDLNAEVASQIAILKEIDLSVVLPDERDFVPDLRIQFLALKAKIEDWVSWAKSVVDELTTLAKRKLTNLEAQLDCNVDTSRALEADQIVTKINAIVIAHNQKRTQIDGEKTSAKESIEKHQAASFYLNNNVSDRETATQAAEDEISRADSAWQKLRQKN